MKLDDFTATPKVADVLRYLQKRGIKVASQSLYRHAKQGKLRRGPEGDFTAKTLGNYLSFLNLRPGARAVEPGSEEAALAARKLKAEVLRMEALAARAAYELATLQNKYMPIDEIPRELAGRAVIFASGYSHMVETRAAAWVDSVAGDPAKADELKAIMQADIDELLLVYADLGSFLDAIADG